MKKRNYIAHIPCRGGCGKLLATATRLGTAAMRAKYAGYCDDCMPLELQQQMQADSTAYHLNLSK